jgi:hypothetical protein
MRITRRFFKPGNEPTRNPVSKRAGVGEVAH